MMDKTLIGEYAGIVWRTLHCNNFLSWDELQQLTELTAVEMALGIGWLAREDKIIITTDSRTVYLNVYHENYL